jgi:hypothetical protein
VERSDLYRMSEARSEKIAWHLSPQIALGFMRHACTYPVTFIATEGHNIQAGLKA